MPRPDPDGHVELRGRRGPGGAEGGRVRRDAARRGRHRVAPLRVRTRPHVARRALGRDPRRQARAAPPRPPRRGPRGRGGLAGGPLLGRDPGRLRVGSRRGRHEGLRRHAVVGRPGAYPRRPRARAADRALLHRGRGGRRPQGRRGDRRAAPRGARALHRGGQRGRRLLGHHPRPPDVPHRGRREGHGLDAADRAGQGRARVDDQPGERDHPALRGGGPDRCLRVAGPADPDHEGAARLRRRDGRHRGDAGQRGGAGGGVRHGDPHARRP